MSPLFILAYCVMLTALVPLSILLFKWRYLNTVYRAFSMFLIGWLAAGLVSWLTAHIIGANIFSTHITSLLMALPLFYFLQRLANPKQKQLWIWLAAGYLVVIAVDLIFNSPLGYNWLSRGYLALVLSAGLVSNVLRLQSASTAFNMTDQPLYWLCYGLLIYYAGTIALDIGYQLTESRMNLLLFAYTRYGISIAAHILFTIGCVKIPKSVNFNRS